MSEPTAEHSGPERPLDTSAEVWDELNARYADLTPGEKLVLADQLSVDCELLARAGIVAMEPDATPARVRYLLAVRRYGPDIADKLPASAE